MSVVVVVRVAVVAAFPLSIDIRCQLLKFKLQSQFWFNVFDDCLSLLTREMPHIGNHSSNEDGPPNGRIHDLLFIGSDSTGAIFGCE